MRYEGCISILKTFRKLKKNYCGILPYFGSTSCLYQRMPMGLSISPSILTVLHQCNFGLFTKQKILQSNIP